MRLPSFVIPDNPKAASQIQRDLAGQVALEGDISTVKTFAALDASHKLDEAMVAAAVLWNKSEARVAGVGLAEKNPDEVFPYIPGFLSFREAPVYLAALAELPELPDLLLVDGQGIAHPRALGIAAHLGVHLDMPSIGVAKSLLYGKQEGVLAEGKGSAVPLIAKGEQIGWVYRSRDKVQPLYVSPGHRVSMEAALAFVRDLPGTTKLPAPLREAHNWAAKGRKEELRGWHELSSQGNLFVRHLCVASKARPR